eukprot:11035965-Heterocapsa_arctica.AAC.1
MNLRTGEITGLRKEGSVFVIDFWMREPNDITDEVLMRTETERHDCVEAKTVEPKDPDGVAAMS